MAVPLKTKRQMTATPQVGMSLPGFHATPAGLVADESLTREQWEQAGQILGAIDGRLMWYVGDWLNAGEDGGYIARGKLDEACKRFGIAYKTAAQAAWVCRKVESSLRREHLSFHHHKEVAGRDDAEQLLQWASQEKATVKQLREHKREASEPQEAEFDEDEQGDRLRELVRRAISQWPEEKQCVAVEWVLMVLHQEFGYRSH